MVKCRFKFLVLILIFIFSINMVSVQSFADNTDSSIIKIQDYTFNTENGKILYYTGNGGDIEIPSQINGIKVTGIDKMAFSFCWNVKSVIIPDTVTNISGAFRYCLDLTSVTIPGSITSIDSGTFFECNSLTSVTIPNSITTIGSGAFKNCNSLKAVTIPDSVTSIASEAFAGCSSLTEINIPAGISSISYDAFSGCNNLSAINVDAANANYSSSNGALIDKAQKTLIQYPANNAAKTYTIPLTVTNIREKAFQNCKNLTGIIIPDSVTSIGDYAFVGCIGLQDMTLPGSITSLGEFIFRDCNLKSLTISKTLKGIWGADDEGTLAFCNIKTIILEEGTTAIGDGEFSCCNVENIIIPNSVTSIGNGAFLYCTCPRMSIPNGVISIGDYAFSYGGIVEISIPSSVTSIGESAFSFCSNLSLIDVAPENKNYTSLNGVLFDKDKTTILQYPSNKIDVSYSVPVSVSSIGKHAFADCKNLKSICIEEGVSSINEYAFYFRNDLTIVTYPGTYAEKFAQSNGIAVKYITVSECPEDINGDRAVNMQDVIWVASHYNTSSSGSNYDKKCDLNNDGVINMIDIMKIAAKFNYVY